MEGAGILDPGISSPARETSMGTIGQSILSLAGAAERRGSDM